MSIRAIGDKIVVTKLSSEEKTESGIILNVNNENDTLVGIVVSAIENVKPGEKIIFENGTGSTITYEGKEYIILKANDILAVVE